MPAILRQATAVQQTTDNRHQQQPTEPTADQVVQSVKLRVPQVRVLQLLTKLVPGSGMTRATLSNHLGNKTGVVVGRAVGYSDPALRATFEQTKDGGGSPGNPCPSLLTLGLVRERKLWIDGLVEVHVVITDLGRQVMDQLGDVKLPAIRDSYAGSRQSESDGD